VRESFRNIRELLAGKDSNPARARQKLAEHRDKITLLPTGKEEITYGGDWKLLGYSSGAEGPLRSILPALAESIIPFDGVFRRAA